MHATHVSGGLGGKRHRLREAMLWEDAPGYYTSPRLLSMDVAPPPRPKDLGLVSMSARQQMVVRMAHLRGMLVQLQQVRAGMALAVALDRTFIMPRVRGKGGRGGWREGVVG